MHARRRQAVSSGHGERSNLLRHKESNGLIWLARNDVKPCSPDERSEIRGGVRVVPDIALLIRATEAFVLYPRSRGVLDHRLRGG